MDTQMCFTPAPVRSAKLAAGEGPRAQPPSLPQSFLDDLIRGQMDCTMSLPGVPDNRPTPLQSSSELDCWVCYRGPRQSQAADSLVLTYCQRMVDTHMQAAARGAEMYLRRVAALPSITKVCFSIR